MSTYNDLDNLDHDDEIAKALGNMLVAWTAAEAMLSFCLAQVFNIDPNMAIEVYYRIPTFESRVKFILAAINKWDDPKGIDKAALETAIEKLSKLSKTRNDWVHNVWCIERKTKETVVFDYRQPISSTRRRKPIKAHDIANHCKTVRRRTQEINQLVPGWLPV